MSRTVQISPINVNELGTDVGPFDIYHSSLNPANLLATGVTRTEILNTYTVSGIPDNGEDIIVVDTGDCNQTVVIDLAPLISPTPSITPSTTPGASVTPTPTPTASPSLTSFLGSGNYNFTLVCSGVPIGNTYYHDGSGTYPVSGDNVSLDQGGVNPLSSGYYALGPISGDDSYMQVFPDGVVLIVDSCTNLIIAP